MASGTKTAGGTYTWASNSFLATFKVGALSALSADLGEISACTLNIASDSAGSWGYARSVSKWWADAANGWILARTPNSGSPTSFLDFQMGTSRFWMSSWGDCGLKMGASPVVSGTTMTGTGVYMDYGGAFCAGTATKNISYNGTILTLNGDLVVTGNIVDHAVTYPLGVFTAAVVSASGAATITAQELTGVVATGQKAIITFTALMFSSTHETMYLELFRVSGGTPTSLLVIGAGSGAYEYIIPGSVSFTFVDQPSAGTYDYVVKATGTNNIGVSFRALTYIEAKK